MNKVQQTTPVKMAEAVLLIFIGCSKAIRKYPITKTMMVIVSIGSACSE
jgi:hypothetical protein